MSARRLVVADPRSHGSSAFDRALVLAQALHAELLCVGLLPQPGVPITERQAISAPSPAELRAAASAALEQLFEGLRHDAAQAGVDCHCISIEAVDEADRVGELAVEHDTEPIVVGTGDDNALRRLLTGHIVPALITRSPVPVLVVHDELLAARASTWPATPAVSAASAASAAHRRRPPAVRVRRAIAADIPAIQALQRRVYPAIPSWTEVTLAEQQRGFPQGQLVAERDGGLGVGHRQNEARRTLCRTLNLKRIIACGRLPGYHAHAPRLTPEACAQRVVWGDFTDPVLSFQLREGFSYCGGVEGYLPEDAESGGHASLIVWLNPDHDPGRPTLLAGTTPEEVTT